MKGSGDDGDMSGRRKAAVVEKSKEKVKVRRIVRREREREIMDVGPPMRSDVVHIIRDWIITEV